MIYTCDSYNENKCAQHECPFMLNQGKVSVKDAIEKGFHCEIAGKVCKMVPCEQIEHDIAGVGHA